MDDPINPGFTAVCVCVLVIVACEDQTTHSTGKVGTFYLVLMFIL